MASIGPLEVAIVLIIALVILGPKKLPDMGRSVGKGMREFKDAVTGGGHDEPEPATLAAADPVAAPAAPVAAPAAHEQRKAA
jgi:sec-independent protein translocase protein TatA